MKKVLKFNLNQGISFVHNKGIQKLIEKILFNTPLLQKPNIQGKIKQKKIIHKKILTNPKIGKYDYQMSLNSFRAVTVKKEIKGKQNINEPKIFLKNFNKKFDYSSKQKKNNIFSEFETRKAQKKFIKIFRKNKS